MGSLRLAPSWHQALGDDDKVLENHIEALRVREEIGQRQAQCTSLINLGRLYLRRMEVDKVLAVLERSLAIACAIQSRPKIYQSHQALSEAHELLGDTAEALKHHREFQRVKEDVFSNDARARLKNLQTGFEVEKAETEAEIARLRNVALKDTNEQLEKLLEELRPTQAQLVHSEKMAALGKLVAGIVHELNSPIGAIRTANDVISRRIGKLQGIFETTDRLDESQTRTMRSAFGLVDGDTDVIASAAARVTTLVRSLKNFARLDESEFQRADIREGIDSALDLLSGELEGRVAVIRAYDDVPKILCYPGELNQVFLTLLTNAAEAIEGEGTIRIHAGQEEDSVYVRIADDGIGIPAERLERLFEFDFTATGSRIKMGAGLVIARNIIHKHRGDIDVQSQAGVGSTFAIRLPKTPPEA